MNIFCLYNLLLSAPLSGLLLSCFLFALCFFCAHLAKFAKIGWDASHTPDSPPEKKEEAKEKKTPAKEQEPVYYIVERKTRRKKPSYGEPKEIRFK